MGQSGEMVSRRNRKKIMFCDKVGTIPKRVGFVVDRVALARVFLRALWLSRTVPMILTHIRPCTGNGIILVSERLEDNLLVEVSD